MYTLWKIGHTVQKCFKFHGYPPEYKTHGSSYASKNQTQSKNAPKQQQQQQMQLTPAHTANMIANAYSTLGASSYSTGHLLYITTGGNNVTLQNFTPQHIQHLIAPFNSQVRVPENQVPSSSNASKATAINHGILASTSSSGNIPFPSLALPLKMIV